MLKEWLNTRNNTSSPKGWLVNALKGLDDPATFLDVMCRKDTENARRCVEEMMPDLLPIFDQTRQETAYRLKWEFERDQKKVKRPITNRATRRAQLYIAGTVIDSPIRFDPRNTQYAKALISLGFEI